MSNQGKHNPEEIENMFSDPRFWLVFVMVVMAVIALLIVCHLLRFAMRWMRMDRTSVDEKLTIEAVRHDKLAISTSVTEDGSLIWEVFTPDQTIFALPSEIQQGMDTEKAKKFADRYFPYPYKPR